MALLRRDPIDDVDVESCLANLHRLDGIDVARILDLRARGQADESVVDLTDEEQTTPSSRP